ncbi:MAG: TonB-dependent receptor plug domain-containing protein [Rhodoferax sp.]
MKTHNSKGRKMLGTPVQLAVLALLAGSGAGYAQTAEQKAESASAALPEVVVTATKRTTSLQSTPIAVTSLNAQDLEKNHVQTVQDIASLVPSFSGTTQGDHGVITMTLRGIGNDSAKTEYADPEIAIFVDGVYSPRAEGAAVLLFDMENIEVLRGPQGTLWGKNSTVGAVNMQTAKPVLGETFGSVSGGFGDYNKMSGRANFNAPISDTMALRVALVHESHDGYVDFQNPTRYTVAQQQAAFLAGGGKMADFQPINYNLFTQGGPKYNAQNQTAARVSLLVKPSKNLSWNVSYEKFADRGTPSMDLMQVPRAGQKHWSALIDTAPYLNRDVDTLRSRVDWDLGNGKALAYTAGYSHATGSGTFDQDRGLDIPTSFTTNGTYQEDRTNWSDYRNFSHEVTLQSTGKRDVDWIVGGYYAAEENGIRFDIPLMNGTQQGTVAWQGSFIQPKETNKSTAVFGQATFNLGDLHLTGGLRYTNDERENIGGRGHGWAYNPASIQRPIDPGTNPADPASGFNNGCCNDGKYSGGKATGLLRANYDVSKQLMVYGSVATGYKSGSVQDGGATYKPETLTTVEFGTKQTLAGGSIKFNNTVYFSDFKDFQFSAPVLQSDGSRSFLTDNVEGAKVQGFESELAWKITPVDRFQATMAFTDTKLGYLIGLSNDYNLPGPCKFVNIGNGCVNVTGNKMAHAPSFQATVQYEHAFQLANGASLTPRIKLHYETDSFLSIFNYGEMDTQKAYTRTDVGLRYNSGKSWWVDGFIRNLEDANIKTAAAGGPTLARAVAQYMPPRTLGVNVGFNF